MYNPKDVFTSEGLEEYRAHLQNIKMGLAFIENNADDLHLGAIDQNQQMDFYQMSGIFDRLLPVLKEGDGETDEE